MPRSAAALVMASVLLAPAPAAAAPDWFNDLWELLFGSDDKKPPAVIPAPEPTAPRANMFPALPSVGFAPESLNLNVKEGGEVVLTIRRSSSAGETVRVDWAVRAGSAGPGDVEIGEGQVVMKPEADGLTAEIRVRTLGDTRVEPVESFEVILSPPREGLANAIIDSQTEVARVTIIDDDKPPPPPPPPGRLAFGPPSLDFSEILIGQETTLELIVSNLGGKSINAGGGRLDPQRGFYVAIDECGLLGPGQSCAYVIGFRPTSPGDYVERFSLPGVSANLFGRAQPPAVVEDPLGARIEALRAQRRAAGGGIKSTEIPPEKAQPKAQYALKDPDYKTIGVDPAWFSLPVNRERIITVDRHIPCVLEDTVNSQVPGVVHCVVEQNVYGSDGRYVLIPAGSRAVGSYESLSKEGDTRLNIVWTRIFRTDGASILIGSGFQTTDPAGRTALPGHIDNRLWERYGGALLLTSLSVASTALVPADNDQFAAAAESLTENFGQITTQLLEENLDLRPVMTVPSGTRLVIKPLADLWFPRPDRIEPVADKSG